MPQKFKYFSDTQKELEYKKSLSLSDLYAYFEWRKSKDLEGKVMRNFRCPQCGREQSVYVKEGDKPKCNFCNQELEEYVKKLNKSTQTDTVTVPRAYDKLGRPIKSAGTIRVSRKAAGL